MSKLTDITLEAYLNFGPNMSRDDNEALATMNKQIKALMLELIGDNSSLDDNAVLKHKAELRKKVEDL